MGAACAERRSAISDDRQPVIIDAVRTPAGRRGGALKDWHPVALLAHTLSTIVQRSNVRTECIDDVIAGCVSQVGEQSLNVARNALLAAGFPQSVPGTTVDRQCGSSQQALAFAAQGIAAGAYDAVIACGVECMTREELDAYGLESHQRAQRATIEGRFESQLVSLPDLQRDEGIRPDTSIEALAALKPAFKEGGLITAGNSSQISDGAAAVLLASLAFAQRHGLKPRARVVENIVVGDDPELMLTAPIPATRKVPQRAGLRFEDITCSKSTRHSPASSWRGCANCGRTTQR